jgi:DNA invertase Pin-like site-specific DNA recombinase
MSALNRAAAYYRMSDDKQENSIDRQRSQVEPFAARNGYTIVREYLDEGIAGDEEAKRKGFMRMLRDAQRRDFRVILCDDKDRFGRFDSIDQGYYVKPLRDAGMKLVTVAQGEVDWNSFAGRITDAVLQEAKKLESQATSRRVITLMLLMAQKGKWLGGKPPYGYGVVDDPAAGKRLVPGDPGEVRVVDLMFRLYGERGYSLEQVARELYERGVPNPKGGPTWNKTTIRAALRNRKYVGDMVWNAGHDGKYSQVSDGLVRTSDRKTPKQTNPVEDWVIIPSAHEALVSRELFERVQARLMANKRHTNPLPKGGDFVLSGLLVCGDCGWRLIGATYDGKRYYKCGRYHAEGRHACYSNHVMESKVLGCLIRKLQETMLNPANLARLREELRRQEAERDVARPGQTARLEKRIRELTSKVDKGMERMALIDPDLLTEYAAKVREWKEERDRLATELEALSRPAAGPDLDEMVKAAEEQLYRLREAVQEADAGMVRELLREMISKVDLHFSHTVKRRQVRSRITKGVIHLRPQEGVALADLLGGARPGYPWCRSA